MLTLTIYLQTGHKRCLRPPTYGHTGRCHTVDETYTGQSAVPPFYRDTVKVYSRNNRVCKTRHTSGLTNSVVKCTFVCLVLPCILTSVVLILCYLVLWPEGWNKRLNTGKLSLCLCVFVNRTISLSGHFPLIISKKLLIDPSVHSPYAQIMQTFQSHVSVPTSSHTTFSSR